MNRSKHNSIDYGNWVHKNALYFLGVISLVFLGLSFISRFFLIGFLPFLITTIWVTYTYYQFSPKGGNLQVKIRGLVLANLAWDGKGKVLDIGCGNGALAIEAAKKYPLAQVTGIDYWTGDWGYSQAACENNARLAGVANRTSFQKASAVSLPFIDNSFDAAISNLVFHEVRDARDKKEVIKESLRVVKKGGFFVFQDLFLLKRLYGQPEELLVTIRSWGVQEVHFLKTSNQEFIPIPLRLPHIVGGMGIIYGKK